MELPPAIGARSQTLKDVVARGVYSGDWLGPVLREITPTDVSQLNTRYRYMELTSKRLYL